MLRPEDELSAQIAGAVIPYENEAQQLPIWFQTLNASPGLAQSMGNTSNRGARTILQGAKDKRGAGAKGFRALRQNANIASRYSTQDFLLGGDIGGYTPFQGAKFGNSVVNAMGGNSGSLMGRVGGKIGSVLGIQEKANAATANGGIFNAGMLSKMSAGGRLASMSESKYIKTMASNPGNNAFSFLQSAGKRGMINMDALADARQAVGSQRATSFAMFGTAGKAGGFVGAARHGVVSGTTQAEKLLPIVGSNKASMAGATRAAEYAKQLGLGDKYTARQALGAGFRKQFGKEAAEVAGKKALLKGGVLAGAKVAAGLSNPIVGAALTAMTVYDVTKMALTAVSGVPRFIGEGIKSYRGNMGTRIFDNQFRDTEATMTSRSRGVQAISNSRLNARSILGNEGAMMASHFG